VQGKAYFQTFSPDVMIEGEPVVRHLDLLTHNHIAQAPGNTPPVPWLSTQSLPALPPPELRKSSSDGPGLKLTLSTGTGQKAEDPLPVDISEAGAGPAPTKMGQGNFEHQKPKGMVVATFHELKRAFWTGSTAHASESIELAVLTGGFPDGTKGTFEIRHVGQADGAPPLASLPLTLKDDKARAEWKYLQPLGQSPGAEVTFVARIEGKAAHAPVLKVVAYPITDVRGVKQALRALNYDAGPPDTSESGPLEGALRKFQEEHELDKTGKLDVKTRATITAMAARGL
jgi:hypothetical protein